MQDIEKKRVGKLVTNNVLDTRMEEVENKIPDTSKLVTNSALNTKNGEVKNNKILYFK